MSLYVGNVKQKLYVGDDKMKIIPKDSRFELLYEWNAEDWTSGNWSDRCANYTFSKMGTPTKGTDGDEAYINVSFKNYFRRLRNQGAIPIPRNWMWEVTFMRTKNKNLPWYLVDWGSLGTASTGGIGLFVNASGTIGINCKPTNNTVVGNVTTSTRVEDNAKHTVRMGCMMYSDTQDIQWIEIVGGEYKVATKPHAPFAALSNPNLGRYFGRGYISNTAYQEGEGRIYSIKIFTDNYSILEN